MKMLVHPLNPSPKAIQVSGATLGQEHLSSLRKQLEAAHEEVVVLDFSRITSVTASYLKATIIWLIQSARLSVTEQGHHGALRGLYDPAPLRIYPSVMGLSSEVKEELDAVLPSYRLPCLEAVKCSKGKIVRASLHGPLDEALADTLRVLTRCALGTASSLCEQFPDRKISVTGWNNRLADLHALRLARRTKEGRQWVYEPVAAEVVNGRES